MDYIIRTAVGLAGSYLHLDRGTAQTSKNVTVSKIILSWLSIYKLISKFADMLKLNAILNS